MENHKNTRRKRITFLWVFLAWKTSLLGGGDEFFIICRIGSAQSAGKIVRRINLALDKFNESRQLPYSLAVSIGHLVLSPGDGATLDYVLDEADKRMYAVKREKYAAH